jgi:hypothetical protein
MTYYDFDQLGPEWATEEAGAEASFGTTNPTINWPTLWITGNKGRPGMVPPKSNLIPNHPTPLKLYASGTLMLFSI